MPACAGIGNVDLDAGTLTVNRTRLSVDGAVVEADPKSERGKRTLPLTKALVRAFRDLRKRETVERLAAGSAYADSGYVVVDEIGRPLHPDTLSDRFDQLVARAGVGRIRLHDARHTCGTLMHLSGEPVAVISAWLGHSSPAFTMRVYVHSQDGALRDAAARLDTAFGGYM